MLWDIYALLDKIFTKEAFDTICLTQEKLEQELGMPRPDRRELLTRQLARQILKPQLTTSRGG
jgi:hypothetical protein